MAMRLKDQYGKLHTVFYIREVPVAVRQARSSDYVVYSEYVVICSVSCLPVMVGVSE